MGKRRLGLRRARRLSPTEIQSKEERSEKAKLPLKSRLQLKRSSSTPDDTTTFTKSPPGSRGPTPTAKASTLRKTSAGPHSEGAGVGDKAHMDEKAHHQQPWGSALDVGLSPSVVLAARRAIDRLLQLCTPTHHKMLREGWELALQEEGRLLEAAMKTQVAIAQRQELSESEGGESVLSKPSVFAGGSHGAKVEALHIQTAVSEVRVPDAISPSTQQAQRAKARKKSVLSIHSEIHGSALQEIASRLPVAAGIADVEEEKDEGEGGDDNIESLEEVLVLPPLVPLDDIDSSSVAREGNDRMSRGVESRYRLLVFLLATQAAQYPSLVDPANVRRAARALLFLLTSGSSASVVSSSFFLLLGSFSITALCAFQLLSLLPCLLMAIRLSLLECWAKGFTCGARSLAVMMSALSAEGSWRQQQGSKWLMCRRPRK